MVEEGNLTEGVDGGPKEAKGALSDPEGPVDGQEERQGCESGETGEG